MAVHAVPSRGEGRKAWSRLGRTRCWLNGREVSRDCFYADPRRGVVRVYVRDADRRLVLDRERSAIRTVELRGRVVVRVARLSRLYGARRLTRRQQIEQAERDADARIAHRVAELMIEHPDYSLQLCIVAAEWEEHIINGVPNGLVPRGFLSAGNK